MASETKLLSTISKYQNLEDDEFEEVGDEYEEEDASDEDLEEEVPEEDISESEEDFAEDF